MDATSFNKLQPRNKWELWQAQFGVWTCGHCGAETDSPYRASPFPSCRIVCGECDGVLTRRTGGGQSDPFGWVLVAANQTQGD